MNGLPACIYKLVDTSGFLASLTVTSKAKLNQLMLVCLTTLYLKEKTSVSKLNLTTLVATSDFKKSDPNQIYSECHSS